MAFTDRLNVEKLSFWLFLASALLLPVGLGGNRPLPFGLAEGGFAASFLLLFYKNANLINLAMPKRIVWAVGLFGVVLLWAFIQTMGPVPENLAHPLWSEASRVLGQPLVPTIALDPELARSGIIRTLTYLLAGCGAYILMQDAMRARLFIQLFWLSGTIICAYGFFMQLMGIEKILWVNKWSYLGDLTGTFVNRNHFALYADMVLVTGLALFMQSWREHMSDIKPSQRIKAVQAWLQKEGFLRLFGMLLILLCLIYSHSRAGLMLGLLGMCLYVFFYHIYRRNIRLAFVLAFFGIILLIGGALLASQHLDRFAHIMVDGSSKARFSVYELTLRAIGDNPLLGYGINGFSSVFRLYQPNIVLEFNRAHSDILESVLELGIPAALLFFLSFLLLLSGLWHGVTTRKRHGVFPCLALAVSVIVLLHVMVDFSLQIPGIAVLFACVMGMGLAQSWGKKDHHPLA